MISRFQTRNFPSKLGNKSKMVFVYNHFGNFVQQSKAIWKVPIWHCVSSLFVCPSNSQPQVFVLLLRLSFRHFQVLWFFYVRCKFNVSFFHRSLFSSTNPIIWRWSTAAHLNGLYCSVATLPYIYLPIVRLSLHSKQHLKGGRVRHTHWIMVWPNTLLTEFRDGL